MKLIVPFTFPWKQIENIFFSYSSFFFSHISFHLRSLPLPTARWFYDRYDRDDGFNKRFSKKNTNCLAYMTSPSFGVYKCARRMFDDEMWCVVDGDDESLWTEIDQRQSKERKCFLVGLITRRTMCAGTSG